MKKLKLFFACLLMAVLSIGQVWAVEDEVHKFNSSNETREVGLNNDAAIPAIEIAAPAYPVKKVAVNCKYNKASLPGVTISVTVGGEAFGDSYTFNTKETKTIDFTGASAASGDVVISFVNNSGMGTGKGTFYVYYVELTEGASGGTPTCATPTFNPNGATFYGESQSVELACATSGATIHYTLDGSNPTASSPTYSEALSLTATTTVKALAVKEGSNDSEIASATFTKGEAVTSYAINFETNNLDAYVNWDFVNIGIKSATITAHGGTYYGANINGDGNGVATASITTKAKYANPGTLTFYISKESGNTTASSWKAQVSEDGEAWTDVETFDAKGMGKGEWNECTADLSSYSNVYVRIAYDGSTAIRAIDDIELAAASATPKAAKPTFETGDDFVTSTSVTLDCATEGASIYYTTNGDVPTSGSTLYEGAIPVSTTTTIKAIAIADGYDASPVAEKTFTKVEALESLAALLEATVSAETAFNVVISNWVVTGVQGTRAWIADAANEKGILLYKSGHGFVVGNKLNGVVIGTKTKLYQGYPEMTTLVSTDVTVTTAEAITPRVTTIAALTSGHPAEQGTVVKLEGVTYESSALSDGVNSIAADNKLFSSLALVDGTTYDITGVVEYLNEGVVKIMPRSADDVEAQSVVVIPTAANLAALKAAERGTYILTLENAVVTYVNGKNAFIEDATGGALIYFQDHGFTAGDCLNGEYQVTTEDYQGKFEITAMEPQTGAAKTTAEIPLTTVSIATLNADFAAYESKRIKIAGANVTDAISGSDRNGAINDGAALAVYAAVASTITLTKDDNVDIIGYPGFHNTDQQLTVWAQADITVNEKDPAGIAFDPASATITAGDAWSAPDFANPNSLDVTFSSDDESVATVSNAGVVALAGGYGTAVITAHTDGDATHNAGNATYTVTVNDPASVDTRKVANSPAAFTTTSGNLNPADITYASYQGGSSTAPAIYNDGIRLYQIGGSNDFGGFVTITAKTGCTIDEVQITTTSKYATTVAYSVDGNETLSGSESVAKSGSYTTGTGLNVSSVNILNLGTGSDGRLEIASIKVYYTGEAATIDHYELGGTYQTAFMQDEEFNHTGLIVYAAYDALGENKVDITSMCTFSEPDMSTTGEKTIEITYNEAVVISYTINVAADSRKVAESPVTFTTVSGDMTPNDITFASDQGGASTAPANYNDGIRLYQAPSADAIGGFITLKAKKGCTIDQVKITTTNSYATTVAYSVDGNENLLGSESVAKSSDYSTPSGLNVESVNIVNKGTGSNGRLEIASIKVWYTGSALSVDHYILGGSYATEFEQFGTFSYEGLTVTAAYDELETITEAVVGFTVEADLSTAGEKKAEVMLNSVKIAEYDITVTAGKEDPALAYTPASATITAGDAWSAPTLSNTFNVTPITYSSDKESVATVTSEGVITLAGGYGTAVITAHFDESAAYIESEATYTITVNKPAPTPTSTIYRKVTATADITDGEYLIVYEGDATHDAAVFDGSLGDANIDVAKKALPVAIVSDEIAGNTDLDAAVFTIDVTAGSLQSASGLYIGKADYANGMDKSTTEAYVNTFAITDGEAVITGVGGCTLRYNYASDQLRFRYYKSGQQAIQLYKKETATPDYGSYHRNVTEGNYGTICLPQAGVISGATLFEIADYANGMIYVDEITNGEMAAGIPYIFQATSGQLNVVYSSSAVEETAGDANGLYGFYNLSNENEQYDIPEDAGNYILYQNAYWLVSGRAAYIANYRAYIKIDMINYVAPAPGRRRVAMTVHGEQTVTDIDALNAAETPVKVMINGQIFILRGEKMYNVNGQVVK